LMYDPYPGENRGADRHLREPFLHKNHNLVCLRF